MSTPESNGGWNFDNSYARLPELFFARQAPVPAKSPQLVIWNDALASTLGLEKSDPNVAEIFGGNRLPPGATPIAQAYAGHQFGHLNMLGDGRAVLLGEQITPKGERFDIQLKGSGQTPFSRRGDGRAALGPMLREYIISEAMAALGIPTTRSLAVVATGEPVYRESVLPGAVLTRIAQSHIRVGTFVYAAGVRGGGEPAVRALSDYSIQRHYPELISSPESERYFAFLRAVADRQASLVAKWMHVGFIHGVMNTDNVTISGETIDYGPCAFVDAYSPDAVFSSIDRDGRYAFASQPQITGWNLARFAETLLPLLSANEQEGVEKATKAIEDYLQSYQSYFLSGMRAKFGIANEESEDSELVAELMSWMEKKKGDFTNTFRALSNLTLLDEARFQDEHFQHWKKRWQERLKRQSLSLEEAQRLMKANNPAVIPRNHRVEEALAAAVESGDLSPMQKLLAVLKTPFSESSEQVSFQETPPAGNETYRTFCGT